MCPLKATSLLAVGYAYFNDRITLLDKIIMAYQPPSTYKKVQTSSFSSSTGQPLGQTSGQAAGQSYFPQGAQQFTSSSRGTLSGPSGQSSLQGNASRIQLAEQLQAESRLEYDSGFLSSKVVFSGLDDMTTLRGLKNILLSLQNDFLHRGQGDRLIFSGAQQDQFSQRLMLLEQEIDGLMRRRINSGSEEGNSRSLDLSGLLNEKENQIVQLERKILNLEEKLRKSSKQEGDLENEIVRLRGVITSVQSGSISQADLAKFTLGAVQISAMEDKYRRLKDQMESFASLLKIQFDKLKQGGARVELEGQLDQIMRSEGLQATVINNVLNLVETRDKVVEVPTMDLRTKHLLHALATQMKKFLEKYPKLRDQCDGRLYEYFQQELIDVIEVDEMERVVEIVKHVPSVVKVENVYAYNNEKSRKVQFHLRVLLKALLEEMEKVRVRSGVTLELDEGVLGMIKSEIMDGVSVDDILKTFRVAPKIVQVEKIVEKIVDRVVEVPSVVAVERLVEKIVEVEKIKEIERKVTVPIETPVIVTQIVEKIVPLERIVDRAINVPTIVDRIVEVIREVPKVVEVEKKVQVVVEVEKIVNVKEVVNHISYELKQVDVVREKIVEVEKIIEKIVEVPVVIEKIVEKIVQVPQLIEVERIVEKIVPQIEYRNAKEVENHIEIRHVVVDRIVQRPVPIIQIEQRIVEVPQIVQKIITLTNIIREPFEVQVIIEKIVVQDRIKEVEVIVNRPIESIKQVPVEVEKIVQVPLMYERIITVTEFIEKPIIQTIERTIPVIVELRNPLIVKEEKIVEIEKIVNNYIEVAKPVKYIQEKIVEVIRHVDRIKEIKVPVEKIIEKMVEVPKVVEVEKIVERIVVVPRVVEKIVEVPQIVERIVPKIIVEERIKEVERIIERPILTEVKHEVQVDRIQYVIVEKPVDRIVDKMVETKTVQEKIVTHEIIVQKAIEVIREVPKLMEVEKIVHNTVQVPQIVEITKQIVIPIEIPVPIDRIIEKLVPMTETVEKIVQIPQVIEKIVERRREDIKLVEIERMEEKIVVDREVVEVVKQVPYISEKIKEVPVQVEKIVPIQSIVQEIVTAKQIVEKVVEKTTVVPKIYEVERFVDRVIELPKIVEVERIIPQLVNVNRHIQTIVEKIVQIPIIMQELKEIVRESEKIVEVRTEYQTVKEVEKIVEKTVAYEKLKEVVKEINHIQKVLQIVDRTVHMPVQIVAHEDRFVEVPYILEKIVEKIVIMPQIVEVLKYVHEVFETETLGVAMNVDVSAHEQSYKLLSKNIKGSLDMLLTDLRRMRQTTPALKIQVDSVEKFLLELEQYIQFPRIVQVPVEKIVEKVVEKEKVVSVPRQDERSLRMEMSLSLLVQKLILELKRVKKDYPQVNYQLEDDVRLIFLTEFDAGSKLAGQEMGAKLKSYADSVQRKFEALGNWSFDHQLMLNSFLQERFLMASLLRNANTEIERVKVSGGQRDLSLQELQAQLSAIDSHLLQLKAALSNGLSIEQESIVMNIFASIAKFRASGHIGETTYQLGDLQISDARIQSLLREKEYEITRLREGLTNLERMKASSSGMTQETYNQTIGVLQQTNAELLTELNNLKSSKGSEVLVGSLQQQIAGLNSQIFKMEQENSKLTIELLNLKTEWKVKKSLYESYYDAKESGMTSANRERDDHNMASPASKLNIRSPDIKMVDSQIEPQTQSANRTNLDSSKKLDFSAQQAGLTNFQAGEQQVGGQQAGGQQNRYGQGQGSISNMGGLAQGGTSTGAGFGATMSLSSQGILQSAARGLSNQSFSGPQQGFQTGKFPEYPSFGGQSGSSSFAGQGQPGFTYATQSMTNSQSLGNQAGKQGTTYQTSQYQQGSNMQGGNIQGSNIQGSNIQGGNMQGSNMQGSTMQGSFIPPGTSQGTTQRTTQGTTQGSIQGSTQGSQSSYKYSSTFGQNQFEKK